MGAKAWVLMAASVGAWWAPGAASAAELPVIGCERAAQRIVLDSSARLDPSCTWTKGVEIHTSHVELDCAGALISDTVGNQRRGIYVGGPEDVPIEDVYVHGCVVEGFLNNFRVEREGFKALPEGGEYDTLYSDIRLESSELRHSRGSGIFVNAYVTDVTLKDLDIHDNEGVGIYLEAGSRYNLVEGNHIYRNGFDATTLEPTPIEIGGVTVEVFIEGREGLAIDGSRDNVVRGNRFEGNAAGGINLYKNCGENTHTDPEGHWVRWYGADDNLIVDNTFEDEKHGVWIGSRMAQNLMFMDCSDPWYARGPAWRIYLDYADGNQVVGNTFTGLPYGVRVEDDDALVEGNRFYSDDPDSVAVILGTLFRTRELGEPVTGATVVDNVSEIAGNPRPYNWIHGHEATTFEGNLAEREPASLTRGEQPPMTFHVFVDHLEAER